MQILPNLCQSTQHAVVNSTSINQSFIHHGLLCENFHLDLLPATSRHFWSSPFLFLTKALFCMFWLLKNANYLIVKCGDVQKRQKRKKISIDILLHVWKQLLFNWMWINNMKTAIVPGWSRAFRMLWKYFMCVVLISGMVEVEAKQFLVKLDVGQEDVYCTHARIQVQHTAVAAWRQQSSKVAILRY